MSTSTTQAVAAAADFTEIEKIIKDGALIFNGEPSLSRAFQVAEITERLRAELTPQRMTKIKALMNTSLGFDTDRNPAKWNKPEPCIPYADDVIRDVFIEACLRGFYPINKEFNIIAGNFYGGVNGFERLVRKHPNVTDFKDFFGVPVMHGDKGAIVKASASWMQNGVHQTLEREFAVRVNSGMGADGIIGKAKRKLYAAVYGRLSGVVTPEGEAGDDVTDLKASATAAAASTEQLFGKPTADATGTPAQAASPTPQNATNAGAKNASDQTPKTTAAASPNETTTPKQDLIRTLTTSGVTFDDFRDFVTVKNLAKDPTSWTCYDDMPDKVGEWFAKNPKTLAECIKKFGNVQAK